MRDLIGIENISAERLKPQFRIPGEKLMFIEIYRNKPFGAIVEIYPWARFHEVMWDRRHRAFLKLPKKEQARILKKEEKLSEGFSKNLKHTKPVNTKNWKKIKVYSNGKAYDYHPDDPNWKGAIKAIICITPSCSRHGAMNKVTPEGIWRCLMCNEGAYELPEG
jgi:hypothetical protein